MNTMLIKKTGIIFMAFFLLLTSLVPVPGFAQYEKGLEDAIIRAKTLFNIPDSYDTFNYSIQNQNGTESYNMNWSDSKNKKGNISVNMLATGEVTNYYNYKAYEGEQQPRIPAVSRNEAIKLAEGFIAKVNPQWVSQLKLSESQEPSGINNGQCYIRYIRSYNGIPFPENNVYIAIDNQTGNVLSFYSNWNSDIALPDAAGVISMEKAQKAYIDKIGLSLLYKTTYSNNDMKLYLAYSSVYTNRSIDAATGEIYDRNPYVYGYGAANDMMATKEMASKGAAPVLTPSEKDAVVKIGKILTAEKSEETARSLAVIDKSFVLTGKNLINDWQNRDEFQWNMVFTRETNENGKAGYYSINVSLDAKTGELLNLYRNLPYDKDADVTIDKEKASQLAEEFIKSVQSEKFGKTERTDWNDYIVRPLAQEEKPRSYSFVYTRKENGAYFPGNGFNITIDATNGSVTSFNCNWFKKELISTKGTIPVEDAYKTLFNDIGLQLQYVITYPDAKTSLTAAAVSAGKIMPPRPTQGKPELKLIYAVNKEKPLNIDPFTAKVLEYDGTEYIDKTVMGNYTDIEGYKAESQIKVLAEYGIALPGTEFKPEQNITQKEFLFLLMKTLNPYSKTRIEEDKAEEEIYNYCIMSGIIKEEEKAPEANITVEQAAKLMVRSQHYDKVAEMKGIFALPFKDAESIQPGMEGYIAVAYGMKAIKDEDGFIYPGNSVTRAGTIQIIYNYLTAKQ